MNKENRVLIGTGVLSWDSDERRSDRYGTVMLLAEGIDSHSIRDEAGVWLTANLPKIGTLGRLCVRVIGVRKSTHMGDVFRGILSTTPDLAQEIYLGTGKIFYGECAGVYPTVGLEPDDGRTSDWLDPEQLYKVHEQSVELYFEPAVDFQHGAKD